MGAHDEKGESGESGSHGSYVHRVRDETRRYLQELLEENESLRRVIAGLESEKGRLQADKLALQERVLEALQELGRVRSDYDDLRSRLASAEAESRRFSQRYVDVEQRNNDLAHLYVASYQLHSTVDRPEVVAAIQEIVINLIGSEELLIFEVEPGAEALRLIGSFGMREADWAVLPIGPGLIGRAAATGEPLLPGRPRMGEPLPREAGLTACIPLRLGAEVLGLVAIFQLLPHKKAYEALDYELFDLLATHAATALYVSRPPRAGDVPRFTVVR